MRGLTDAKAGSSVSFVHFSETTMTRLTSMLFPLALLGALAPIPLSAQAGDEAGVRKLIADFSAALDKSDAAAYAALHSENAYVIDLGVPVKGRQALTEKFKADIVGPFKGMKFIHHTVESLRFLSPTQALGITTWEVSIPGQANMKGNAFFVASKQGNRWVFEGWDAGPLPQM